MGKGIEAPARVLLGGPRFSSLVERRSRKYARLLRRSGKVGNPVAAAGRSISASMVAAMVAFPASLAGALLLSPWLALGCVIPPVVLYLPELGLRDEVAKRKEGVERELPFFSVLVGVLGGAGVPLYTILEDLLKSDVFPSMKKEALLARRDVSIFGMNPNEAFERLASDHPSRRFGEFLLGYTSKVRSGGDVPGFLTSESGSLLKDLEDGWMRYVARVGIVGSMMITVFGVVPLLLMVVGVFSPGFSMFGLLLFTGLGVPLFTLALLFMAGRMQPTGEEPFHGRGALALVASLAGAPLFFVPGEEWLGVAASLLAFFFVFGLPVRRQIAESRALDDGVSKFLGALLEYKRQDYDLSRATVAIEAHGGFGPGFAALLARVATKLKAGVPLDEIRVECRSRVGRLAFLLLGEMSRSGGGTVDTVFQVSGFVDRVAQMRRSVAAEMKPYLVLSMVSPLLLAFGLTFVSSVLSTLGQNLKPGLGGLAATGMRITPVPPGLAQVSDMLIVVSAAALGLIGAKVTDFTARNTVRGAVNVALAVAGVAVMGAVGSHSLQGLFLR